MGVQNSGQGEIGRFFGLDPGAYYGTGAGAGTPGIGAAAEHGQALAEVVVTIPGATSQGPQPSVTVGSDDTETPAAAALYNQTERLSGVHLNTGGEGADHMQFGQDALEKNQVLYHPNSLGVGRRP